MPSHHHGDDDPASSPDPIVADADGTGAPDHGDGPVGDGPVGDDPVGEDAATGSTRRAAVWRYARWPVFVVAGLLAGLFAGGLWLWSTTELPALASAAESAVLLDRNGEELAVLAQDGLRIDVALDDMAPEAVDALVAAEDRRFYDHEGVDPVGIARAFWNNLTDDRVQGGSTITQQLVKNVYLDSERTIARKVREAMLAVKLERSADKDEILERYLNTVYFGRGAYGLEAAARAYFATGARDLTLDQAALLIGLIPSPESLDPVEVEAAALERRNQVLDAMSETGALSVDEAATAKGAPIEVLAGASPTRLSAGVAPHFVEKIRRDVVDQFGERALYERGLIVHTTLDVIDQRAAEASIAKWLDDPQDPQGSLVAVDDAGAVRAWVGGRDYETLKLDLVSDDAGTGRQPGSTFKPVVLAANLDAGYGAGQRFHGPTEITLDLPPEPWTVTNAGGGSYGRISLAEATVHSVNTVYAQALAQVGPQAVADLAGALGVESDLEAHPPIGLGAEEVTPLDMATAFSTLSRGGVRIYPYTISKVETRERDVLFEAHPEPTEALEPRIAHTVNAVLSEVPRRGTATTAALDRPMAAKTGTTQRNADAWLAGYTPNYTAVVWIGDAESNEPMGTIDGEPVFGGSVPAKIWRDFMYQALDDVPPDEFEPPDPELLSDTTPAASVTVSPRSVDPGGRFVVTGTGFHQCVNAWQVRVEGPMPGGDGPGDSDGSDGSDGPHERASPLRLESAPQTRSTETDRTAQMTMAPQAAPGTYEVSTLCDYGAGPRPQGPAVTLEVRGEPAPPEPSTSPEPASPSTAEPGNGNRNGNGRGNGRGNTEGD